MGHKTGKEMRSLMLAVSVSMLLLVLAIIAYFMVDIVMTTNNNIEHNKQKVIEESIRSIDEISGTVIVSNIDPATMKLFSPEVIERIFSGDVDFLFEMAVTFTLCFYPVDYIGIIYDGELVAYGTSGDEPIDPEKMPVEHPEKGYETLDSLGDREGFFVSVFNTADLGKLGFEGSMDANMIVDRTAELAEIESYFTDQRNDLLIRLSIASVIAIILTILLTTFGLRHFTRKYVAKPVEELNLMAQEIAEGTFEGDVKVDEASAYAALQGLLRSGQKVLRRMDQELK